MIGMIMEMAACINGNTSCSSHVVKSVVTYVTKRTSVSNSYYNININSKWAPSSAIAFKQKADRRMREMTSHAYSVHLQAIGNQDSSLQTTNGHTTVVSDDVTY